MLTRQISRQPGWDFSRFLTLKAHLDQQLLEGVEDDRFPVYPQRLVADVRKVMPDDGVIALDNGVYKIWFARNYMARQPNTVLSTMPWRAWAQAFLRPWRPKSSIRSAV